MSDRMLDFMIESENARIWEDQNEGREINRYDVCSALDDAWNHLSDAYDELAEAVELAEGHAVEDRISSLLDDVEAIQKEIKKITDGLIKEVKGA